MSQTKQNIADIIAALTDEQRDRIITAQRWTTGELVSHNGEQCLAAHAFNDGAAVKDVETYERIHRACRVTMPITPIQIGTTFDTLVGEIGFDAAVSYCKALAVEYNNTITTEDVANASHSHRASTEADPEPASQQPPQGSQVVPGGHARANPGADVQRLQLLAAPAPSQAGGQP